MARTDNLTNFLTDIADSIRLKTGKSEKIAINKFDTEISSIALKKEAFNLFVQLEEPELKEGIWIQTNQELDSDITVTNKPIVGSMRFGEWQKTSLSKPTTNDDQRPHLIGDWVYWVHYSGSDIDFRGYKLNLKTGATSYLASAPARLGGSIQVAVGTDIYTFGGDTSSSIKRAYKYDTIKNNFTRLPDLPRSCQFGAGVSIGNYIYFSPGREGIATAHHCSNVILRYDIVNKTYKQYTIPTYIQSCGMTAIGDWIYFVGTYNNANGMRHPDGYDLPDPYAHTGYKWNVNTEEWVELATLPRPFNYFHCKINGRILMTIGSYAKSNEIYIYNPITNGFEVYDTLHRTTDTYYDATMIFHDNTLYEISRGAAIYKMPVEIDPDYSGSKNALVVYQADTDNNYQTTFNASESNSRLLTNFADVSYYSADAGVVSGIPIYYGDGNSWVQIKY